MSKKEKINLSLKKQPSMSAFLTKKESTLLDDCSRSQSPPINLIKSSENTSSLTSPSIYDKVIKKPQVAQPTIELSSSEEDSPRKDNKRKTPVSEDDAEKMLAQLRSKYGCSPSKKQATQPEKTLEKDKNYITAAKKLEKTLAEIKNTNTSPPNDPPLESQSNGTSSFRFKVPIASQVYNSAEKLEAPKTIVENPVSKKSLNGIFQSALENDKEKPEVVKTVLKDHVSKKSLNDRFNMKSTPETSMKSTKDLFPKKISNFLEVPKLSSSSVGKENFSIKMSDSVSDNIERVLNSNEFRTNDLTVTGIEKNLQTLHQEEKNLLKDHFQIFQQLPANFLNTIPGLDKITVLKLQSAVQSIQSKIKLLEKNKENIQKQKSKEKSIGKRISRVPSQPVEIPETLPNGYDSDPDLHAMEEEFIQNDTYEIVDPAITFLNEPGKTIDLSEYEFQKHSKKSTFVPANSSSVFEISSTENSRESTPQSAAPAKKGAFQFKKPMSALLGAFNTPETPSTSTSKPCPVFDNDDDDLFDTEEIMSNYNHERLVDRGAANHKSFADLSATRNDAGFQPRINLKNSTVTSTSTTFESTSDYLQDIPMRISQESEEPELDDDGFPIIDYHTLEDVIPSQPENFGFQTAKQVSQNEEKRQNTINSMIPSVDPKNKFTTKKAPGIGNFYSGVHNDGITGEFDGFRFPHTVEMRSVFREKFGLNTFRPNQLQAINATLLGYDCFILMPTGGGKSLCYQLPALLTKGVTIVISPLKSLILDQVNKLQSLDIPAAHLSGDISLNDTAGVYRDLESSSPKLKLLYVTPEKISASPKFQEILDKLNNKGFLGRFVIDEAHCVSAWGHDFRPDYKKLSILKTRFPKVSMLALTATANRRVRSDVLKQLSLTNVKWFLCSFNRPNLKYIVLPKKGTSTLTEIIALIKSKFNRDSGIIYCLARKDCDMVAEKLSMSGIKASSYHAGLADKKRESVQKDWISDKFKVVCATIAFGMGIDKPDVRYVFHYSMPKSIEGYYQESGRAGRDGDIATCILYYNYSDMMRYRKMMDLDSSISWEAKQVNMNNLNRIVNYCENVTDCRRTQQLEYFAEHFTREQCLENRLTACDNCLKIGSFQEINALDVAMDMIKAVKDLCTGRNRFTILHMVEVFKGSEIKKIVDNRHDKTAYHGKLKTWDKSDIQRLIHKLVIDDYLMEEMIFTKDIPQAYIRLGPKVDQLMNQKPQIKFAIMAKQAKASKQIEVNHTEDPFAHNPEMKKLVESCYNDLMDICRNIAAEKSVTMASIMNPQAIKAMSQKMPETQEEMLKLPHVTKANFEKYGQRFLDITLNYSAMKASIIMDLDDENDSSGSETGGDNTDWAELGRAANSSSTPTRGRKRRGGWGGRGSAKKYKRARKTPKKKATRGGAAGTRGKASTSTVRRPANTGFKLLPMPGASR